MKVTVTKEVAEAIEYLRKQFSEYQDGATFIADHAEAYLSVADRWEGKAEPLNDVGIVTFARAVLNGYEVVITPEEKVREYYEGLKLAEDKAERHCRSGSQHRQGWISVTETLNILGIKIRGVNA